MDAVTVTAIIALGAGILSFLVTGVNIWYTERIKGKHQAELERLKADLGRDTEAIRSQLGLIAFEHQTRFSRLHERRVDVVAELYRRLVRAEGAFNSVTFPLRSGGSDEQIAQRERELRSAAADAGNYFSEFFQENRIWLDAELCAHIHSLARTFRDVWYQYTDPDEQKGKAQQMHEAWRTVTDEVPKIREEIETHMRILLGVLDAPQDNQT